MITLAIANFKGGVGKTATTHNLGAVLAADHGRRVLLVDCDPQSSLTNACGVTGAAGANLTHVMGGTDPGTLGLSSILWEVLPGLDIAPAGIGLAPAERGLVQRRGREYILKRALADVAGAYDVCVIDTPPSLGLLTENALTAADGVLIPVQPKGADLRGLMLFLGTLDAIRADLNPRLETFGVLVTFYDTRRRHDQEAIDAMQSASLPLLPVMIGTTTRIAEAATVGQPVTTYAPNNPQAENYRRLAERIDQWLNEKQKMP